MGVGLWSKKLVVKQTVLECRHLWVLVTGQNEQRLSNQMSVELINKRSTLQLCGDSRVALHKCFATIEATRPLLRWEVLSC